jgi:hypothetical protein
VTVTEAPSLGLTADQNVTCFGGNDGAASVAAVGNGPFTYLWSNGATGSTASNLTAGQYSVVVTDASGCSSEGGPINISSPEAIQVTLENLANDQDDQGVGAIDINVSGGNPTYSYAWTFNGLQFSDKEDLTGLHAGLYVCVVTDASGCFVTSQTFEIQNTVGTFDEPAWAKNLQISPNPTSGKLNIQFTEKLDKNVRISLRNALGQLVFEQKSDENQSKFQLDFEEISVGTYFIFIQNNNEIISRRVVIAR